MHEISNFLICPSGILRPTDILRPKNPDSDPKSVFQRLAIVSWEAAEPSKFMTHGRGTVVTRGWGIVARLVHRPGTSPRFSIPFRVAPGRRLGFKTGLDLASYLGNPVLKHGSRTKTARTVHRIDLGYRRVVGIIDIHSSWVQQPSRTANPIFSRVFDLV